MKTIKLKTILLSAAILVLAISSISAQVATGGTYTLTQSAVAGGGGSSSGATYTLDTTLAQALAGGPLLGSPYDLGSGFLFGGDIPTTTTVTSSANPSVFGQNVTFTATVSPIPFGGTVTFVVDGNPLCSNVVVNISGQSTCSTSALSIAGSPHSVVADYSGSVPYLASSGTLTGGQVVNKANTTTTVTAAPASPSVFGQSVTFTATVAVTAPGAGSPTGTVTFNIDGILYCVNTPLTGLTATCTQAGLPALPAGVRNVVALYSGDTNFNGSNGTLNYTVNKASTTITITGDTPDPTIIGQPYAVTWATTVTAPGAGTPTGTVTVSDGSATCSAPVGAGTCNLTSTTAGNKTLIATYSGDANFNGSVSAGVPHVVNLSISGTVRNGITNAPVAGEVMILGCASPVSIPTTTTNAAGQYSFAGQFVGPCFLYPNTFHSEPFQRNYATVPGNITNADFLIYANANEFPRKLTHQTQYVVPGAAGTMPVILNSQDNEATLGYSITYDINPFAQPPTFVCGANAPGCTITNNTTVFGKVGVTITPAGGVFTRPDGTPLEGPEAAGPKEIARINFQTAVTTLLPSTDFTIGNSPVTVSTKDAANNDLLTIFVTPARVVFAQGREGDVAGRNAGNGAYEAADLVQMRRFISGLDIPVTTHNEFQRADTAPAASKGDGTLNATDLVQARRYVAGLDAGQSAGGAGAAAPAPMAPPAPERAEGTTEITIGDAQATNGTRISVPVSMRANGNEVATSFTVSYDETRLTNPNVTLADGAPEGAVLTFGKAEAGYIRVLIDSTAAFGQTKDARLVEISFDVLERAASGNTSLEIEDLVFSDAGANQTRSRATNGTISIAGSIPADDTDKALTRVRRPTVDPTHDRRVARQHHSHPPPTRERGETQQPRTITRGRFQR
ncbi:MAG: Ig-like domain repeat protein [Acidobacteria bacterium]|nr:Ig-like domain repeat protein [Acidobacteriota bacterium]